LYLIQNPNLDICKEFRRYHVTTTSVISYASAFNEQFKRQKSK